MKLFRQPHLKLHLFVLVLLFYINLGRILKVALPRRQERQRRWLFPIYQIPLHQYLFGHSFLGHRRVVNPKQILLRFILINNIHNLIVEYRPCLFHLDVIHQGVDLLCLRLQTFDHQQLDLLLVQFLEQVAVLIFWSVHSMDCRTVK